LASTNTESTAPSPVYKAYPIGIFRFEKAGKHSVSVLLLAGDPKTSSLQAVRFSPVGEPNEKHILTSLSSDGK